MLLIIVGVIIALLLIYIVYTKKEYFTGAVITQLQSTGSMDRYLTDAHDICNGDPLCLLDEPVKKSQNTMFQ